MTIATSRHRRIASFTGLGVTLFTTCLLPAAVRAAGFSGSFDPSQWSIVNIGGGVADQTLTSFGNPPITNAAFYCGNGNNVACVEKLSAATGAVDVVGSSSAEVGGGTAGLSRTTTWTVNNGSAAALLSFDLALSTFPTGVDTDQTVSYLVGLSETIIGNSLGSLGSFSGIAVAPGESFGFRVTTAINTGDYGILSITNFQDAYEVPGPLPLAGGVAAFSWSRRLRRRISTTSRA